jgi:hypothetical protein
MLHHRYKNSGVYTGQTMDDKRLQIKSFTCAYACLALSAYYQNVVPCVIVDAQLTTVKVTPTGTFRGVLGSVVPMQPITAVKLYTLLF